MAGFNDKLNQAIEELPDDWDALHLGGSDYPSRKAKHYSNSLLKCDYTTGAFGVLINKNIFDLLINTIAEERKEVDLYYAELQSKLNWFRTRESLVKHKAGWSEIKQKQVDYKNLI